MLKRNNQDSKTKDMAIYIYTLRWTIYIIFLSSNHVKQGGPICSIDDVIVYGRNELWVIKKHMVKCRVESVVVCIYLG